DEDREPDVERGADHERVGHARPEEHAGWLRQLPYAAARVLLALRSARDVDRCCAHAAAHEQLLADASMVPPAGGTAAGDHRADDAWPISELDQPERDRHIPVPAQDAAEAEGQGHSGDLHRLRPAAP